MRVHAAFWMAQSMMASWHHVLKRSDMHTNNIPCVIAATCVLHNTCEVHYSTVQYTGCVVILH